MNSDDISSITKPRCCVLAAWSSPRSSRKAAGEATAFMGEEIRPSPNGIVPAGLVKHVVQLDACGSGEKWINALVVVASVSVWRRGAVRREERRSDRQDVRLSPRSVLQLFPAEVLMSLAGYECSVEIGGSESHSIPFWLVSYFFNDAAEEQVRWTPEHDVLKVLYHMVALSVSMMYRRWYYHKVSVNINNHFMSCYIAAHNKLTRGPQTRCSLTSNITVINIIIQTRWMFVYESR